MKKETLTKAIKSLAKPLLISAPVFLTLFFPERAYAPDIAGFFINAPQCSVKIYRKPTGSVDTLYDEANADGLWVQWTENFEPPAQPGETLYVEGGWNLGGKAKTFEVVYTPLFLDLNLNKFTACIENVHDSSHVNAPLKAIYSLQGVAPCTTEIDTGYNQGFTFYYDIHVPFDTLAATQGKPGTIRLEKTLNDTTWFRNIDFTVDRTKFDAQLVKDSVYFPQGFSVFKDIGIEAILVPDSADSGQVINPGVVIRNYGTINQNPWLHCKINEFYHDSTQVVAQPGIDTFYFAPCTLSQVGNWLVTSYSVLPGDVNSSNDTLQKTIVVNSVGIEESKLENKVNKFEIYPSLGNVFKVKGYRGKVSIYDATGRRVAVSVIQDENGRLNLGYLPKGVYFVKPEDSNELIKKVVRVR